VWKEENGSYNTNVKNIGARKKKSESNELNEEKRKEEIAKRRRI